MSLSKDVLLRQSYFGRFFHIRVLRHILPSLTEEMTNCVACNLIQSRLDYTNSLYIGKLRQTTADTKHARARSYVIERERYHISPVLKRLHWLPIRQRASTTRHLCSHTNYGSSVSRSTLEHYWQTVSTRNLRSAKRKTISSYYGLIATLCKKRRICVFILQETKDLSVSTAYRR